MKTRQFIRRFAALFLAITMILSGTTGVFAEEGKAVYEEETIYGSEDATCTCGSTGDTHATNCPKYIPPESPKCTCAAKCTDESINVWCDVCGVHGAYACEGTGSTEAVKQEETDDGLLEFVNFLCTYGLTDENGNKLNLRIDDGIELYAADGDTGTVTYDKASVNEYNFSTPYNHYGTVMYLLSVNGEDSFCVQPWYLVNENANAYTASQTAADTAVGKEAVLGKILANYFSLENPTKAHQIATQVMIWETLFSQNDYYSYMISGANCTNPDATARVNAYKELKAMNEDAIDVIFWDAVDDGQAMVTMLTGKVEPDNPPDTPTTPGRGYGTITITKKDNNGKSLDGASFSVDIDFASGKTSTYQVEVTDGTYTLRFDFPEGDTDAATVTVTETKAPTGYVLDGTPQTQTVYPTYAKASSSSSSSSDKGADEEAEALGLDDEYAIMPLVEDSGEDGGDGKSDGGSTAELVVGQVVNYVFVDEPAVVKLVIEKYEKGSAKKLAGAKFRVAYADPDVCADTWDVVTGEDGTATCNLPKYGTVTITETEAPAGYKILTEQTTVVVQAGETTKTVAISNDKYGSLLIKKYDQDDGRLLPGATFEVTKIGTEGDDKIEETAGTTRTVITGADGTVLVENLEPGSYKVEEVNPPQNYVLSENPIQTVTILEGSHPTVEVSFFNKSYGNLKIIKVSQLDPTKSLAGAVFEVYTGEVSMDGGEPNGGDMIWSGTTPASGIVTLNNLVPGKYTVFERTAPEGYLLSNPRWQTREITDDNLDDTMTFTFEDAEKPNLKIRKVDEETGEPLAGAVFQLRYQDGSVVNNYTSNQGEAGTGIFTTDENGEIYIEDLDEGFYTLTELRAPTGYLLPTDPKSDPFQLTANKTAELTFTNQRKPTLTIEKIDKDDGTYLAGAVFKLTKRGAEEYTTVTTDENGKAEITDLGAGWYIVEEIKAPNGYLLDAPTQYIELTGNTDATVTFKDTKTSILTIRKVDATTRTPLANAQIGVYKSDGQIVKEGLTDENGEFILEGINPGTYKIKELKAPSGYTMLKTEVDIVIEEGKDLEVVLENEAKQPLYISKVDSETGKPLGGAVFSVSKTSGEFVGEFETAYTGYATVTNLDPGYYVVTEIKAPSGYQLSKNPKTVQIKEGVPTSVTFENDKLRGIQLLKVDEKTGEPLTGVKYKITKADGDFIGEYKTDANGLVTVSGLEPGAYVIKEVSTIAGYILDMTPHTVMLDEDVPTIVEVELTNKPLAGLQIRKIDGTTKEPLEGVEFTVETSEGTLVGKYATDENGNIYISNLNPGTYKVTETTAAKGYTIDSDPHIVVIKSGEMTTEVFKDYQYPVLKINKIDMDTNQPLEGATFKLMDSTHREIGYITTGETGYVVITGLTEGEYFVQEVKAPDGYVLDGTVRQVSLYWGKTTVLEIKNEAKGSLRIQKVDSVTGEPLYGATFNLYKGMKLLGEYTTDNTGMIIFTDELEAGTYKVKEVKAPDGYVLDDTPVTITINEGETTEITLKNKPETGNIRITKVSSGYNELTKDKKGDALEGAVFEIYDETGTTVDRITTGSDGVAKSKDLPLGKYAIKEITAPKYYSTDGKPFYAELKKEGDLVKFEVENTPTDISTTIKKRGNTEVLPGDSMTWELYDISNSSNVALDEFYVHDLFPTDAVRVTSMTTGVWSEREEFTVYFRTNLDSGYRVLKSDLLSTTNHELALTSSALGLKGNEYVTDVKLVFGTVQSGFHCTVRPTVTAYVLPNLPAGYAITNRADVGGRNEAKWVYSKDAWTTIVIRIMRGTLPVTGSAALGDNT